MKFLIQKINKEIRHDFVFTLLEAIRFDKWLHGEKSTMEYRFINTIEVTEPNDIYPPIEFKPFHKNYIPIGSIDFVTEFLQHFYGITPKPINVPKELFKYAERPIINGNQTSLDNQSGIFYCKSNDTIKGFASVLSVSPDSPIILPVGNYQFSTGNINGLS